VECRSCGHENLDGEDACAHCGHDLTHSVPEPKRGRLHELILEDPISQLNAPSPITLKLSDTVSRAVDLMRKHRFGSVLVVGASGSLEGICTERDLCRKLQDRTEPLDRIPLSDVMTPHPQTLTEDDTIAQALNCMAVGGYRHVPILRDGSPVGFVSIRGILTYIAKNAL
jgi:CBS domain-containing protein